MKDCNQCGKCCVKYGAADLSASKEEIEHWETFHPEIFQYVKDTEIWFDPNTGAPMQQCPFLEVAENKTYGAPDKYTCGIYEQRPEDCRLYPSLISEMIRDECEMLDRGDLDNTRQAQIKLDFLMQDSHHGG